MEYLKTKYLMYGINNLIFVTIITREKLLQTKIGRTLQGGPVLKAEISYFDG